MEPYTPNDSGQNPAGPIFQPPAQVEPGAADDPLPAPPTPFTALDRRVIQLWRISGLLGCAILALPGLAGLVFLSYATLNSPLPGLIAWCILVTLGIIWTLWYPVRAYQAWGYRVEDRVLEIRSGVWFRVIRFLPLSRLQHVDLHRGPLERAHGLASLTLHTAGTREASLGIPGLVDADAERLRDRLAAAGGDDAV